MPRARNIKPAIMSDDVLASLDPFARLLQTVCLPMLADREGRLEDRPKKIWGEAFPYDRDLDLEKLLTQLFDHGYIDRYSVGSKKYIQILDFAASQKPHGTEKDSQIPDRAGLLTVHERSTTGYATGQFKLVSTLTVKAQLDTASTTVKTLTDNALIPDDGFPKTDLLIPETRNLLMTHSEAVCDVLREHRIQNVNPKDARLQALINSGCPFELWIEAANIAIQKAKPTFHYVLGIVGNKQKEGASNQVSRNFANLQMSAASPQVEMEKRAVKVGLGKWQEEGPYKYEHWPAYCQRVIEAELNTSADQK